MKAAQDAYQPGPASRTLFTASFGISLLIHGLALGWMLSSSGRSHALLSDAPSFQMVSLVDAPPTPEPVSSMPALQPRAIPEVASAVAVQNVVPEAVVPPPQAKQATAVPEASVEPPAPVAKPKLVEASEKPSVVETRVRKLEPAKASAKKPAPAPTSARKPTPAAPEVAAAQPKAAPAPEAVAKPRSPASRNSPQAATRAQETIANLRRAQAHAQGTNTIQADGGIAARMSDIRKQAYVERVRTRITNAWHLPMMQRTAQGLQAVALLTIDREGQVIRYQLLRSSGSQPFDASLQRAVQASSPLPPLPETYSGEILQAEIHFTPPASS